MARSGVAMFIETMQDPVFPLERLHTSEQLQLAFEIAPIGMLMVDRLGKIVLLNSQAATIFGYARHELLGRPMEMLMPERFRGRHALLRETFSHTPQTRQLGTGRDLWGLRKDGAELPVEIGLHPIRTTDGDFILGSIVDLTMRKRAVDDLRVAIEGAPTGLIMVDPHGKITLVSSPIEQLFGYTRGQLAGELVEVLLPARFRTEHARYRAGFLRAPEFRPMGIGRELYGLHRDGREIPIEIGLSPLHAENGNFVLAAIVDITERKRAEQALRESEERLQSLVAQLSTVNADLEDRVRSRTVQLTTALKEREVLLQEVHHRVKNNLQVISSLINMQIRRLEDGASRSALEECKTRVEAIGLIHEKLYQSRDYARVPFSDYAGSLVSNILHATGVSPSSITLDMDIEHVSLSVDKAIPCGLILNELITNALKHAFPGERQGRIRVEFRRATAREIMLSVSDDGVGMTRDIPTGSSSSLGMQLVVTLVEQLDGQLDVVQRDGMQFRITFPVDPEAAEPTTMEPSVTTNASRATTAGGA
jgi:PAS domain S-box-containing protein